MILQFFVISLMRERNREFMCITKTLYELLFILIAYIHVLIIKKNRLNIFYDFKIRCPYPFFFQKLPIRFNPNNTYMQYQNQNDKLKKHKATFAPFEFSKYRCVYYLYLLSCLLIFL